MAKAEGDVVINAEVLGVFVAEIRAVFGKLSENIGLEANRQENYRFKGSILAWGLFVG